MAKYAKDQPAGFINRIERVAIIGVTGQVGSHLTAALLSTGEHTITALSRKESTSQAPAGVTVHRVDYDNEEELVDALRGQQFLIISIAVTSHKDTQTNIIKAAAKAGIEWIMPNVYGTDIANKKLMEENLTGAGVYPHIKVVEEQGISWVAMCCSFWYEYSLGMGPNAYGFDFANKKVTFVDDGSTKINTSTWLQCGNAIKGLLSLKELPDDENDTSVTLSDWRDKPMYISSFLLSQRDILDSVNRVTGRTDADWTIVSEEHEERYSRALGLMKAGDSLGFAMALYTRVFYPNGGGNFQETRGLDNEKLGVPKEDLDEATKRAVGMVEGGFKA